jgi:hypothetical protein
VERNVFNDDNLVVDYESNRRSKAAQRHEVKTLAEDFHRDESDNHGHRDNEAGHDRRSPVP